MDFAEHLGEQVRACSDAWFGEVERRIRELYPAVETRGSAQGNPQACFLLDRRGQALAAVWWEVDGTAMLVRSVVYAEPVREWWKHAGDPSVAS